MYKVGDKVKVIEILCDDYEDGIRLGDIFEVAKIRTNLSVGIKWKRTDYYPLINDQIEKVEESKEMSIEEVQKELGGKIKIVERESKQGGLSMYYVVSTHLPTVAMFVQISRTYAFKRMLVKQGIQASVIQTEREE